MVPEGAAAFPAGQLSAEGPAAMQTQTERALAASSSGAETPATPAVLPTAAPLASSAAGAAGGGATVRPRVCNSARRRAASAAGNVPKRRRHGGLDDALPSVPEVPSSFPPWEPLDYFRFEVVHRSSKSNARVGRIHTPHGVIDTPGFVAVGTNGVLKAVDWDAADREGLQLAFSNTYHMMLHPGADVVEAAGGLHRFAGRRMDRPMITDSGGFQVFSLAYGTVHEEVTQMKRASPRRGGHRCNTDSLVRRIDERGVEFKSYRDGSLMTLTPEGSVAAQKSLGADIILPLDELPPYHIDDAVLEASLDRSHRWMTRSLAAHLADRRQQAMYGIVHGGMRLDLRRKSVDYLAALPFDGFAVGGSLGKDRDDVKYLLSHVLPWLPQDKPVHILGIADDKSLPQLVPFGADTFDSCYPTRAGRHGTMLTANGPLRVGAGANRNAHRKPVEDCECNTCKTHTLAFLHHLKKANEPLMGTLLAVHNIHYMVKMMAGLRAKILADEV